MPQHCKPRYHCTELLAALRLAAEYCVAAPSQPDSGCNRNVKYSYFRCLANEQSNCSHSIFREELKPGRFYVSRCYEVLLGVIRCNLVLLGVSVLLSVTRCY